jgi:O-antigen ligase
MPAAAMSRRATSTSLPMRALLAVMFPMIAALTVTGTYLNKEIIITVLWLALSVGGFLFIRPVIGIAVMTAAFLLAAYPTLLQALGFLTINNLLGICFVVLLALRILETRDLSFLKIKQVQVLMVIGLLLLIGTFWADWQFPMLQASVGKMKRIDKTADMGHDFVARLVFLIFFCVFVRTRADIKVIFMVFMLALFAAVPSALINMATGSLNRGFRAAASVTSGANPNRLAMICLMEIACWWFWAHARPGTVRRILSFAAMGACVMVLMATGSRSGLLGLGVLGLLLQTGPRSFRVPATQIGLLVACGAFAVVTMVPAESWNRMITFNPDKGEIGASSNTMREETLERAWEMAWDYPLFGIGLGNFREVSRQVYQDAFYRPPHNSYLWAMSEGGMLVLAGYMFLFWITWKDLAVVKRLAHRDREIASQAACIRVVFLLYFFFSGFADLWLNPVTYVLLGLVYTTRRYVEELPDNAPVVVAHPVRRALPRPRRAVA